MVLECHSFYCVGDRSKVAVLESNHQTSYHPPCQSTLSGLSASVGVRPPATRQINQSSIKLKDHTKAPAHYFTTTTTDTFQQPGKTGENVNLNLIMPQTYVEKIMVPSNNCIQ